MIDEMTVIQEKGIRTTLKKGCVRVIMCISVILSGILLIPAGIVFLFIYFIWKMADKIICFLDD